MPLDPHKNIFYYYRGPSKRQEEDIIYDKQIEDNTTKALINCFENSSNNLLKHFIDYFSLNLDSDSKPQYLLQVSMSKSRPDAEIKTVNSSIYIESKVTAGINEEQLNNHLKELSNKDTLLLITANSNGQRIKGKNIEHINWSDIHKCFKKYESKDKKEKFIIEEFNKYLEVIGLTDFTGFNSDDFDFFVNMIEDYKPIVKNKLDKFSKKVYEKLDDEIKSIYDDKHIGIIPKKPESIWFGIRKDQKAKNVFKHCNFTIEMDPESLSFNAVIRDGKYNQKAPIGILYRNIKNNFDEFLNILKSFDKYYSIKIFERVPKSGSRIMPGNERWVLLSRLTLGIVTDETVDYIMMLLKKIKYPGIHIGLNIKRGVKTLQEPKKLIEIGKTAIEKEYKILKFLES